MQTKLDKLHILCHYFKKDDDEIFNFTLSTLNESFINIIELLFINFFTKS